VWLCLIVLLVQLARKIFLIGKVLLFSEPWLKKYGPLLFAGLNKTLEALDAMTPDADPNDKEFKSLLGQLNLWRRILAFLKNPYLLSRWAWVLAVVLFAFIYTYFAILFSFGYYGMARVSGVNYSWAEALTTSMFLPLYATDLPKPFAIRLLGGLQGSLILAVGIGTVMNFLRRKLDAVRRAAIAFSDRLDEQVAGGKHPVLESMRSATHTAGGAQALTNEAAIGTGDDEDDRFSGELDRLRQQVAAARSSEGPDIQLAECERGANLAMEPGDPASALFELGERHEMRIERPKALDAYRSAWEIEKRPKYGIRYASVAQVLNRIREAVSTYEEILGLQLDLAERADVLSNLGVLYKDSSYTSKAERAYTEALAIRRKLAETAPEKHSPEVASTLNNFAILYHATQRDPSAEEALCEALAICRKFSARSAQEIQPRLAASLDNLGLLYAYTQRPVNAEECFREALEIRRNLAGSNPFGYLPDLANTLTNLGIHCWDMKQLTEAQRMFEEALAIRRALAEVVPESYLPEKATSLHNLGVFYADTNRIPMAENSHCGALAIYRRLAEIDPDQNLPNVASTLNCLGKLYGSTQRAAQAEEAFGEALEIRRRFSTTDPATRVPEVVATLGSLAEFYLSTKRIRIAAAHASEAERLLDPLWRANPALYGDEMARVLATRAQICESIMGSGAEARTFAKRAFEAALDPSFKEEIQLLIESVRSEQTHQPRS
jgi:tetratricopeptide (TPR) repeat protein